MMCIVNYFAASLVCDRDGTMLCGTVYHSRTVFDSKLAMVYKQTTTKSTNTDVGWAYEQLAKLHKLPSAEYTVEKMECGIKTYRVQVVRNQG